MQPSAPPLNRWERGCPFSGPGLPCLSWPFAAPLRCLAVPFLDPAKALPGPADGLSAHGCQSLFREQEKGVKPGFLRCRRKDENGAGIPLNRDARPVETWCAPRRNVVRAQCIKGRPSRKPVAPPTCPTASAGGGTGGPSGTENPFRTSRHRTSPAWRMPGETRRSPPPHPAGRCSADRCLP